MDPHSYIAKVEPDGTGRLIYLGHGSYPNQAGLTLLTHYQDPAKTDSLLDSGSLPYIEPELADNYHYHGYYHDDWDHSKPALFTGGTDNFFLVPYHLGPEWLYCHTPDGWLASPVQRDPPRNYFAQISALSPEDLQVWFDTNTEPEWVAWRRLCRETQQPRPLNTLIEDYQRRP